MESKSKKNKAETKKRLLQAVGEILAQKGFSSIGVNAVARQAGVDKVLIYRYFGDLDSLIKVYAQEGDFWPTLDELLGTKKEQEELKQLTASQKFNSVFRRYANAIKSRPLTLEILAWEMLERNSLTVVLEEVREVTGLQLMSTLSEESDEGSNTIDFQRVSAIFSAAVHYLALRARKIKTYNGLDLTSDQEWERLIDTMQALVS